jgi:hypothetical protein
MVLLHYKRSEKNQFLMETKSNEKNENVLAELVAINNLRVKIDLLIKNIEGLSNHGPLRPEALRGLTTAETYNPACETMTSEEKKYAFPKPGPNQRENPDNTGYRLGIAPSEKICQKFNEVINEAKTLLSVDRVEQKKISNIKELEECVNLMKGAIMIAYPAYYGLPEWDPVYMMLEDKMNYKAFFPDCDFVELEKSVLWWAKKELKREKLLGDFIGKNEKTKIIVKLGIKGQGAPMSEPPVDQETQKKMMAFYYKKQEEMKKLEENNEDDYLNSEWANPNYLKNNLVNGGKDITFKGLFNR